MAYPSGSGSEILRRGAIHNQVNADTSFKFDGTSPTTGTATYVVPTNHIITILNISFQDQNGGTSVKTFQLCVTSGGVNTNLLYNVSLGAHQTYVWNDRIVLHPTDKLWIGAAASSNIDVYYTYLDQNWE